MRLRRNSRESRLAPFSGARGGSRDRFFQIESHGIEQKLPCNLGHAKISRLKEAKATLEGAAGTRRAFHADVGGNASHPMLLDRQPPEQHRGGGAF